MARANRSRRGRILLPLVVAATLWPTQQSAYGVETTWSNAAGGTWSTGANWFGGSPANGADNGASFAAINIPATETVTLDSARTLGYMIFGDTSGTSGWVLTDGGVAGRTLTLSRATGPSILTATDSTVSVVLAGSQGLNKLGSGVLTLSKANVYSGGTTISGGTLKLAASGATPAGSNMTIVNGSLELNGISTSVNDLSFGNATTTGASRSITNAGVATTFSVINNFHYYGVSAGTSGPGVVQVPVNLPSGPHTIDNPDSVVSNATYDVVFKSPISGLGSLIKAGGVSYYVALGAANTYTGNTTVTDGQLVLGANGALPSTTNLIVNGGLVNFRPGATENGIVAGNYSQTVNSLSGSGGTIDLGSATLTVNQASNTSYPGVITGPGGNLIKQGAGNLTLTGANAYTGNTTISAGVLIVGANNTLPVSTNLVNNSYLGVNANLQQTVASITGGGGGVGMSGTAIFTVNQATDTAYTGNFYDGHSLGASTDTTKVIKTGAGKLTLTSDAHALGGGFQVTTGTLEFGNGGTTGSIAFGNIVDNATVQFNRSNAYTYSGNISGTGAVKKLGAGTLTLSGNNTFSGGTTIAGGTIALGSATALASASPVTIVDGALDIKGQSPSISDLTFGNGTATGTSRTVINSGAASTMTLTSGIHFYGGGPGAQVQVPINLAAGVRNIDNPNNAIGSSAYDLVFNSPLSGSGTVSLSTPGNPSFYVAFATNNSYTGLTSISNITLFAAATNALPNGAPVSIINGGNLYLTTGTSAMGVVAGNYSQSIGSLSGTGNIHLGSATLTIKQNTGATFSGSIDGTGGIETSYGASGTLVLSGNSTYSGDTNVLGRLTISGTHNGSHGQYFIGSPDGTLTITGTVGATGTPGPITITSGGQLTVQGGNATFQSINHDSIFATVAINTNGKLKISQKTSPIISPSRLIGNNVEIWGGGQLDITNNAVIVESTDAGNTQRNAYRSLILSGKNGVDANGLTKWDGPGIVSSAARSDNVARSMNLFAIGIISNHDLLAPNQPYGASNPWLGSVTSVGANDILVRYTYNGDTNLDGIITFSDYVNIDSTYGGTAPNLGWVSGDFNFDGSITFEDYVAIDTAYAFQTGALSQSLLNQRLTQFGPQYVSQLQSIVASLSAVPEPTGAGLLLTVLVIVGRRNRR